MGNSISITVFLNGVDVIRMQDKRAGPGVIINRLTTMDISQEFADINNTYSLRIKAKIKD